MKPSRAPRIWLAAALLLAALPGLAQVRQVQPGDSDQTLRAMRDEMERSKARLGMPGAPRPYYIGYRLLDIDVRSASASFGDLLSSSTVRNRIMAVDVRVGDYHIDSSNFVAEEGFRGFLGSTGQVGIDRDYNSLRQDLWLATDQAYKEAVEQLARKDAFLHSLARPPEINDFSRQEPAVLVGPRLEPDWTSRNWEEEAKQSSAVLRSFSQLGSTRVTYYLAVLTSYLMTSEGTEIRVSRSLAAVEASAQTQADDGMPLHNFYTLYTRRPAELPDVATVRKGLEKMAQELVALRASPPAPDYAGPMLFDPRAAGALVAQMLGPSLSGARPPLAMVPLFQQMLERVGGRSEWSGRVGTRVLPPSVTLVDDPTAKDAQGQPLLGSYEVDAEGVRGERVTLVENGILRNLLMSRRPGPDFERSNGHGRAAFLSDPRPALSNLSFQSSEAVAPDELRKKFLRMCREEGREWCVEIKAMDNAALASHRQDEFDDLIAGIVTGAPSGDRIPLLVYRVYVADGHEEFMRGARLSGVDLRELRSVAAIGNDSTPLPFFQNGAYSGTALAAFGSAQGGLPSTISAPSLLFEDLELRGPRGESRRPPLIPAPPLN